MTCDHLVREGLMARELGQRDDHVATCADCQAELVRYRFVDDIARLVATSPAPPGWERRVWAAIDRLERPRCRRWLSALGRGGRWLAVPALVAAIAVLVVVRRPSPSPTGLSIEVEVHASSPVGEPRRAIVATVGDEVGVYAAGAEAVWVYGDAGALVDRCPGPGRCRRTARSVTLTFRLALAVRYRVLAVAGAGDLAPAGDFDRDVLAARARGARLELRSVQAASAP